MQTQTTLQPRAAGPRRLATLSSLALCFLVSCGTPTYVIPDAVMQRAEALPPAERERAVVPALRSDEVPPRWPPPLKRWVPYRHVAGLSLGPSGSVPQFSTYQNRGAAVSDRPTAGIVMTVLGAPPAAVGAGLLTYLLVVSRHSCYDCGIGYVLVGGVGGGLLTIGLSLTIPGIVWLTQAKNAREVSPNRSGLRYLQ